MVTWFLSWLYDKYDRLWFILESQYDKLRDVVLFVWEWITFFYSAAVDYAREKADEAVRIARDEIYRFYIELWDTINYIRSILTNLFYQEIDRVVGWISGIWMNIEESIRINVRYISGWVNELIHSLTQKVDVWIRNAIAILESKISPLLVYIPFIGILIILLNEDNRKKLTAFFNFYYKTLHEIATDPIGFLSGFAWDKGIEFLSFLIGYGMGSVKYKLPPLPGWIRKKP